MKLLRSTVRKLIEYGDGFGLLVTLFLASLHSFLLFHSLLELIGIVIAFATFLLVWNSRRFIEENTFYLTMGIGFLFVAVFGLLHTLTTYGGVNIPLAESTNVSMQFWLIGRYFEAITLLLALVLRQRRIIAGYLLAIYTVVFLGILLIVFQYNLLPPCYQADVGLTLFHRLSEWMIMLCFGSALFLIYQARHCFHPQTLRWLMSAIVFSIFAELFFSLQQTIEGTFNTLGHYCKLITFYLIYKAIIQISLVKPFDSLFHAKQREIKQRRDTELALRNQEYLLRSIIDSSPHFIFWKDIGSIYLGCNTSFAQFLKLDIPAQIAGKADFDFVWDVTDAQKFRADDRRIMRNDQAEYHIIESFQQPGKTKRWADTSKIPLHDASGKVIGIVCIVEDITQRKLAETLLQQSEARYRAIVEAQTDLVCRFLPDTTLTFVNDAYCCYFNTQAEEILGKKFLTLIPETVHQAILDHIQHLLTYVPNTLSVAYEHPVITPTGETAWQQWIDQVILDSEGQVIELQSVGRDITQNKQIEATLRENANKLNAILENLPVMVSSTDTQGNIVLWNRECERITGYNVTEIVNNPQAWTLLFPQKHKSSQTNQPFMYQTHDEWTLSSKTGVEKVIAWSVTPVSISGLTSLAIGQDITARKKAEQALRLSKMRLAEAQQIAHLGSWEWDFVNGEQQCSEELFRIFGLPLEEDNRFTLETFEQALHPEDSESVLNAISRAIYHGESYNLECRIIRAHNKAIRHIQMLGKVICTSEGHSHRLIGTVQDITERKQIEEAFRKSEERFELAMLGANDGLWDWNLETNAVYLSPRFKQQLGFQEDTQLSLESALELLHPDDIIPSISNMSDYLEGKISTYENIQRMYHQQGYYVWILNRALAIRDEQGQPLRMVGTHVDITAQKQIEQELQIANTALGQFKTTLDLTLDSVFMLDANNLQFLYVNQGAIHQLGYSEAELLDMTFLAVDTAVENAVKQEGLVTPLLNSAHPIQKYETYHQRKNGQRVPVEIFLQYVQIPEQPARIIGIGRDITERKQAELGLQQAKEVAEVANRAKSTFLANMSHELRTPLNSILGYAQILKQDTALTSEQIKRVDIIYRSGEYLLTLINDVLDLAKIEAGHIEVRPTPFAFDDFLKSITELFEIRAKQKGITFVYQPLSFLPQKILADERRLRQVLINLLGNAIKFTDRGKVALKIGYHEGKMRFQIEDTGIGIARDDLDKIFLPFQQVGNPDYHVEGTGLGLAITKKLVETMGGELHAESVMDKGSQFWFALNLPEIPTVNLLGQTDRPKIIGYKRDKQQLPLKILVIDDKAENRSVLVSLLEPLGFEVSEAHNGEAGLKLARKLRPHLIFLDLVMPIIDGFETVRRIRQSPIFDKTVVIAVSASVFDYYQHKSLRAGCNGFVAKPVHLEELLVCLETQLKVIWVYQEKSDQSPVEIVTTGVDEEQTPSFVGPTVKQALTLYELTKRGNINGIITFARQLIDTDAKLTPFADKVIALAENLQKKKILALIKPFMDITQK